jgi:hypothetical protein
LQVPDGAPSSSSSPPPFFLPPPLAPPFGGMAHAAPDARGAHGQVTGRVSHCTDLVTLRLVRAAGVQPAAAEEAEEFVSVRTLSWRRVT